MTAVPAAATGEAGLATIIEAYNEVTERLKQSHEILAREVCRLREELHAKNKELQRRERLAALGEMAAGVAHEIRNPLGGIGLYASLLERDLSDQPKLLNVVRKMSVGVCNLEGIVSDILTFAGDVGTNACDVSAGTILDAVAAQVELRAETRRVTVQVDPMARTLTLHCDAGQIERALINLVFNAIDAAGADGTVWIRGEGGASKDGWGRLVVEDDGPGVAADLLHRIFDPFFTTKDTGTGLGLAIVHRIAESNGGSVTAGHRAGGGARFVLTLPVPSGMEASKSGGHG